MPKIRVKNVNVAFKTKTETFEILKNVNVTFPNKKITAIIGKSGCGKTTLVKSILGLVQYEGDIFFDDANLRNFTVQERSVSYVGQNFSLFPNLTAFNNIALPLKALRISGEEVRRRVFEIGELLGIRDCLTRKPKDLSIGQCQRVAIGRALIKRPNAYLFDEPFSALDNETSMDIFEEMKDIFKVNEGTVLFVCHDIRTALLIADYFVVMDEGTVIESGNKEKMINSENPIVQGYFATV